MTEYKTLEQKLNSAALEAHRMHSKILWLLECSEAQAQEIKELKELLKECLTHPVRPDVIEKIRSILKP